MKNVKIIFVVGPGRSGSTLLGNKLQTLGYGSFVCELFWWLTHPASRQDENFRCDCNQKVPECEFWSELEIDDFILNESNFANRNWRTFLFPGRNKLKNDKKKIEQVVGKLLERLETPIIETSKSPIIARFLKHIFGDQIYVIRSTRPSSAIINSWRNAKAHIPARSSVIVFFELLWYKWLLYIMKTKREIDLELSIDEILELKGVPLRKSEGRSHHAIGGNPSR